MAIATGSPMSIMARPRANGLRMLYAVDGKKHGHDTRGGHGAKPLVGGCQEMLGGDRMELGRQRRAARVVELIRVDLEPHPGAARGVQDPAGLADAEHSLLAEHIAEPARPRRATSGIISPVSRST